MSNWIKKATDRMDEKGTKGSLTRIAKSQGAKKGGKISQEWLRKKASMGGKVGKKAQFALAMRKCKH